MPTTYQDFYVAVWTVGQALDRYRGTLSAFLPQTQQTPSSGEIINDGGFKALRWSVESSVGFEVPRYTARIVSMPADYILPYRYLLMDPLWNGTAVAGFDVENEFTRDWGFMWALYLLIMADTKKSIIESCCDAVCESELSSYKESNDNHVAQGTWTGVVTTDSEVMMAWETLCGYRADFSGNWFNTGPMEASPNMAPGAAAVSGSVDAAGVIRALQDIAKMDITMSLNNRGPIFSLRGRAIVEP